MTILLLAAALLCPTDGEVVFSHMDVRPYMEDGTPVISQAVPIGSVLRITATVRYLSHDIMGRRAYAFSGGQIIARIDGQSFDLTPTNGVPLLGPPECGGVSSCTVSMDYRLTNMVQAITVDYGGASSVFLLNMSSNGRLSVAPVTNGALLSFYGTGTNYEVQASSDLKNWSLVGTTQPVGNKCEFGVEASGETRFWRYRRL